MTEELYRYDDSGTLDDGVEIYLSKFPVIRKTPKGYWIRDNRYQETFCLAGRGKRYAHETKELAYESFKARKRRQLKILSYQKRRSERVRDLIEQNETPPDNPVVWDIESEFQTL